MSARVNALTELITNSLTHSYVKREILCDMMGKNMRAKFFLHCYIFRATYPSQFKCAKTIKKTYE